MAIRVAINGFWRIGRCFLRAALEDKDIENLLKLREQNDEVKIDQFMNQKLDEIIM